MPFFRRKKFTDPLENPKFREPGFMESLRESIMGVTRPLSSIQIEITSHCAGKCGYCPHTTMAEHWKSRHMSADVMASLWPLLKNSSHAHLQGWGEPLLHPRFFDFVKFARKAGCQTSTTSCGTNLGADILERIVEAGPDIMAFSLTGTDAESNSSRTGVNFGEVCANIKKLAQMIKDAGFGPELHIAYLLLADQLEALEKLPDLLVELDVDCAVVSTLDYLALPEQKKLAFGVEDYDRLEKARDALASAAEKAKENSRQIVYALPDGSSVCATGCRENIANSLYVDADGQISPCVYLNVPSKSASALAFGNALEENVWEIWKKPEYLDFRQTLVSGETPSQCAACPKRRESLQI